MLKRILISPLLFFLGALTSEEVFGSQRLFSAHRIPNKFLSLQTTLSISGQCAVRGSLVINDLDLERNSLSGFREESLQNFAQNGRLRIVNPLYLC